MKTKIFISFIAASFLMLSSIILINKVFAQEITGLENIQYPVAELENCEDQAACKLYCDKPENTKSCVNFAEKNNLMSQEELQEIKKFMAVIDSGVKGPGGCINPRVCEKYCDNISHINECISFAEENNLIPPPELAEAKKVQAAIKRGVKPPACGNKKACDIYCDSSEHMEECITFAEAAGFLQGKELSDAQKMLAALKRGVKAPPCKGKDACDEYCSNPDNMELCMNFALEAGFMEEQEKDDAQKMLAALKKGIKPPKCKNKEDCDVYCSQDEHFEECANFAEAAGFMTAEESAMARKTGGKGPGGCKGKDECEAFCNNPDNQETCFNFAKENGLISEQDLKQMEQGKQKFKESMEQAPSAVIECLNSEIGSDMMEKFKSGAAMPPKEIGDKMRGCFEKMGPSQETGKPGQGGMMPPAGQTGPGGCKTAEECAAYCISNPEACQNFTVPNQNFLNPNMPVQDGQQPQQPGEFIMPNIPNMPNQGIPGNQHGQPGEFQTPSNQQPGFGENAPMIPSQLPASFQQQLEQQLQTMPMPTVQQQEMQNLIPPTIQQPPAPQQAPAENPAPPNQ